MMAKFAIVALLMVSLSGLCAASRVPMSSLGRLPGRRLLQFANITLPDLPYAADALEPVISEEIMTLHHDRHHQAYVNGFNTAVARLQSAQDASNVSAIVDLTSLLNFNGGGTTAKLVLGMARGESAFVYPRRFLTCLESKSSS